MCLALILILCPFALPLFAADDICIIKLINELTKMEKQIPKIEEVNGILNLRTGEDVVLSSNDKIGHLLYLDYPDKKADFTNIQHFVATFIKPYDKSNSVISIKLNEIPHFFIAPNSLLNKSKTINDASKIVSRRINLSFTIGEHIRYRDADGLMYKGIITSQSPQFIKVSNGYKKRIIPQQNVFKSTSLDNVSTPLYKSDLLYTRLERPSGKLLQLLNSVAKITSTKQFLSLSHQDRFTYLLLYLNKNIKYHDAAIFTEQVGYNTLNKVLCSKVGVCRHLSVILGKMLQETGYDVKFTFLKASEGREGHAWLEVKTPENETIIVDPSDPEFYVKKFDDALEEAQRNSNNFESFYYTNPNREFIH